MKVRTFSIVAGSMACNAKCPFCVAHMTPANGISSKEPVVNWRNFRKACQFARDGGCVTAMITSKGEPTIFPDQVTRFLKELSNFNFPVLELQTNGILIADGETKRVSDEHLQAWYDAGLNMVAISVCHWEREMNKRIYMGGESKRDYIDLPALIEKLHRFGFSVRLAVVMLKGYIDSPEAVDKMILRVDISSKGKRQTRDKRKPMEQIHGSHAEFVCWRVDAVKCGERWERGLSQPAATPTGRRDRTC